jgi:hypothetical protein
LTEATEIVTALRIKISCGGILVACVGRPLLSRRIRRRSQHRKCPATRAVFQTSSNLSTSLLLCGIRRKPFADVLIPE